MSHSDYQTVLEQSLKDPRTLGSATLEMVQRYPESDAVCDVAGSMTRIELAGLALTLPDWLGLLSDEQNVGILLPPGKAGTLVNLALALMGRTAVNLNHTAGEVGLKRMCELGAVQTIITAETYTDKIGQPNLDVRWIDVQKVMSQLPKSQVQENMRQVQSRSPEELDQANPDDVACLIFSSGSTGEPKGVQLTHRQILANMVSTKMHHGFREDEDRLLTPLPLFHSFGISVGTWLPLIGGFGFIAHPDPRDGRTIGELAQRYQATFLIGTPTFVRGYMRRVPVEQFASIRLAIVGAEKCPDDLRVAFQEKYGGEILEGYGCTELAPVVSLNQLNKEENGVLHIRNKPGSVGRAIPGVEILTLDPESKEILPQGQTGLVLVRSPSRMSGYLGRQDLTDAAFLHGGYNTGDIGHVDADGFLFITGRLARFAKIGGEMVPLDLIEEKVRDVLQEMVGPDHDHDIAISSVFDESRGEKLVFLYTSLPCPPQDLLSRLTDLPALYKPKERDCRHVQTLPVLGTGKRDLRGLANLAKELVA